MKLNNIISSFAFICAIIVIFDFNKVSAKILYYGNTSLISSNFSASVFSENDSLNKDFFTNLEANLFARKEISDNFHIKSYASISYLSNRKNDDSYSILEDIYFGLDTKYGNIYFGNTPSVYYNGFPAGWLDYKVINSKYDAIDPRYYGSFFATKSVSKSVFYSYQFSNFKIALQTSLKDNKEVIFDNQKLDLTRKYNYGLGLGYAYGLIEVGGSYINSKFDDINNYNNNFITTIASIGAKVDIFGIYSAIGAFYDKNRWDIGNESYSFQYLLRYDEYKIFNKKIIPQFYYSYKYYSNTNKLNSSNVTSNNDIYVLLSYFLNDCFEVFIEGKIDIRNPSQVKKINNIFEDDKYLRYNRVSLGFKGTF